MNSKQRMQLTMNLRKADRVPVMCQLSFGHYFLYSGVDPLHIWFTAEGLAEAMMQLRERYQFDGILVNLPGREPDYERRIENIEQRPGQQIIRWKNGNYTEFPADDNPHYFQADGSRYFPRFEDIDPEQLFYIEPWDITGMTYPYTWGFERESRPFDDFFPPYHFDNLKTILQKAGRDFSIHSEVFSPWSQFLDLLNYENALLTILLDPGKVKACLERLTAGAIDLGQKQAALGVDAVLISSAFAGGGFISRQHYEEFVLPYEKEIITGIKSKYDVPVYTHTCGKIGDRLDLMLATGTYGIDTLDPPPLGTVDLQEAKKLLSGKAFIKGNIDPVNTLLNGDLKRVAEDVQWRLSVGKPDGGYILSSACSVSPHTPPENIEILAKLAREFGRY